MKAEKMKKRYIPYPEREFPVGTVIGIIALMIVIIAIASVVSNYSNSSDSRTIKVPFSNPRTIQIPFSDPRTSGVSVSNAGSINIPADYLWYYTGIWVEKGQKITFEASGSVSGSCVPRDGAYKFVGPNGWSYEPSFNRKRQLLVPDAPFMSLVGGIGTKEKGFFIGSSRTITAKNSGMIYLASNDAAIDEYGIERPEWWKCNPGHYDVKKKIR